MVTGNHSGAGVDTGAEKLGTAKRKQEIGCRAPRMEPQARRTAMLAVPMLKLKTQASIISITLILLVTNTVNSRNLVESYLAPGAVPVTQLTSSF